MGNCRFSDCFVQNQSRGISNSYRTVNLNYRSIHKNRSAFLWSHFSENALAVGIKEVIEMIDMTPIWESKRAYRRRLAQAPIAEKLHMLDALRERTLAIRRASTSTRAKNQRSD